MSHHDAIVVGGGFTGLSAAQTLANAGLDVALLEARERVGGRVESRVLEDGVRIDTGGQFFCEDMPEVSALAQRYGKTFVRSRDEGDAVFQPSIPAEQGYRQWDDVAALRRLARSADLNDPAVATLTVSEWVARQQASDAAKGGYLRLIDGLWCRSPDEISFVALASSDRRITNRHGELEFFLAETMHSLADDLATELGARVRLASPVTKVQHDAEGVSVEAGGRTFSARRAIVALPPVMARRLVYQPALPERLLRAFSAWGSGLVIKALARYQTPFWRKRALSGTVIWSDPKGLYACDVSHDERHAGLVVFIGGPLALEWHGRSEAAVADFIRERLMAALGREAGHWTDLHIRDWTDDAWSGGAYSDVIIDVHATDAEEVILQGLPVIRFAASELSPSFPGYIEGAITAGKAAARDIRSQLTG